MLKTPFMKAIPLAAAMAAALMCGSVVQAQCQSPSQSSEATGVPGTAGITGAMSATDSGVRAATDPREANVNAGGSPRAKGTNTGNSDTSRSSGMPGNAGSGASGASGDSDSSQMGTGSFRMMPVSKWGSSNATGDGFYPNSMPGSTLDPNMQ